MLVFEIYETVMLNKKNEINIVEREVRKFINVAYKIPRKILEKTTKYFLVLGMFSKVIILIIIRYAIKYRNKYLIVLLKKSMLIKLIVFTYISILFFKTLYTRNKK